MSLIQPFQGKAVNPDGTVTMAFQVWLQKVRQADEARDAAQDEIIQDQGELLATIILLNELVTDAEAAIENVNNAAEALTASSNLATSFVENFVAPVVSADSTGLVTVADHDRHYGDGTIVSVVGDTLATGEAIGTVVYVYYVDPARAGGAVTYQHSTVEADAAQIGDTHNVGAVEIPAAGTASGGYARPPGYGGIEP